MKNGVLIIECPDDTDPGSEGRLLQEVFRLMEVPHKLLRVQTIQDLISAVSESEFKYVHVATHGVVTDNSAFKGWWSPKGTGTKKTFSGQQGTFGTSCIVSTACRSGVAGFGRHVVDVLGSKYYIAPTGSPLWHNAALFSHIFYYKLFRTKTSVRMAFKSYDESYKNPHDFKLYARAA